MSVDRRTFLKVAGAQAGLLAAGSKLAEASANAAPDAERKAPAFVKGAPDIVVIGAGAFGGWTALNLQKRGMKVLLVDAFGPGNSRATSGDETRGIRSSYGNRSAAAPGSTYSSQEHWMLWARRAIEKWKQWDAEWGKEMKIQLFYPSGDLIFRATEDDNFIVNNKTLWEKHKIKHELLNVDEVRYRYPQFNLHDIKGVLYEPDAGVARARRSCEAVAGVFQQLGGEMLIARAWPTVASRSRLEALQLSTGDLVVAGTYVFALGPWFPGVFPALMGRKMRTPLAPVFYLGAAPGDLRWTYPNIPSWNFNGVTGWPGIPNDNRGFRIRTGGIGNVTSDPDYSPRWVPPEAHEQRKRFVADRFPDLVSAPLLETRACHYEGSINNNFIIDHHPDMENVWMVGAGNSEGFKFGPVIGEYAAKRILGKDDEPEYAAAMAMPAANYDDPGGGGGRGGGGGGGRGAGGRGGGTGRGRGAADSTAAGRGRGAGADTTAAGRAGRGRGDTTSTGRGRGSDTTSSKRTPPKRPDP